MNPSLPIGVFDSGLGGLSVLKELRLALPNETFLYLGDVARLPYGSRSASVVTRYVKTCVEFLVRQQVKMVVIACNTATAMALESVRGDFGIEIKGVIEPGVSAGIRASRSGKVLVLATESAVKSEAYRHEFFRQNPAIEVEQLACPLLVPLAEEGWFDHPVTVNVIQTYLSRVAQPEYDVIVLGCTHYPLLESSFRRAAPPTISLVHGAIRLAEEVKSHLASERLLNPSPSPGAIQFYSTDHIPKSLPMLKALFGTGAEFELVDL